MTDVTPDPGPDPWLGDPLLDAGYGPGEDPHPDIRPPAPEMITVQLANARKIGGRARWPGDVVTLPADEARDLIREGLATRA